MFVLICTTQSGDGGHEGNKQENSGLKCHKKKKKGIRTRFQECLVKDHQCEGRSTYHSNKCTRHTEDKESTAQENVVL